ncbi:DUF4221 family protein [Algoriphagus boritolerans]|uniref:TolB-like 6-blade propeller-like n=1 Tax=Algoriphagus boritolerans DSM 17298 = JCM 18970 TaxID=1120964 RepID=A0A1H5SXZ7_9BACT|nr:DUF4221 family protein [Algoriphagus boritolerans]SEF55334.1 protein of unknown function [Algoriphagus boritolerans DSM 17298 = JCM 18970]
MKALKAFIFCISIFSCSPKEEKIQLSLTVLDSIKIPLDSTINPNGTTFQYINSDSGEYLALQNKAVHAIEIFNLEFGIHAKRIKLQKDGPNRSGEVNGFRLFSNDSLLVASYPQKLMLFNFEGLKTSEFPVKDSQNDVNYISSTSEIPFLFDGKKVFGAQPFFRNFFDMSASDLGKYSHIYQLDMESVNPEAEWLPISNPEDTWKEGKKVSKFTWTDRGDSILVSPYNDHRIWVISKKSGELLNRLEVKAPLVNQFHIIKGLPSGDQGIIEELESDRYELLLYDQFRAVFYRFYFVGIDVNDFEVHYRELYSNRPKIGLLVLDTNLKIIGNHLFDTHQIEPWNYFVGRKGLYVSTNNPNRDDFDENYLRYDIIRFEGLEYED